MSKTYIEYKYEQKSPEWILERSKLKLTGSNVAAAVGHCPYKKPEDLINPKPVVINKFMQHGMDTEPLVRKWYSQRFNVEVKETGIIVPLWNRDIGGSLDGLVGEDGIIEIKCPFKMYPTDGLGLPLYHYDQIQFYLAITDRKWCDYIVYTDKYYLKRILRNHKYWDQFLYPEILKFLKN